MGSLCALMDAHLVMGCAFFLWAECEGELREAENKKAVAIAAAF
jgi:hypothetical protein